MIKDDAIRRLEQMRHLDDDNAFCVDTSTWARRDWEQWKDLSSSAERARDLAHLGREVLPRFDDLQNDSYHYLYQSNPVIKDRDDVSDKAISHLFILRTMDGLEDVAQLRALTQHNRPQSVIALSKLNEVLRHLPEGVQDAIRKQQHHSAELEQKQNELEGLRQMWQDLDRNEDESNEQSSDAPEDGGEETGEGGEETGEGQGGVDQGDGGAEGTGGGIGQGEGGGGGSDEQADTDEGVQQDGTGEGSGGSGGSIEDLRQELMAAGQQKAEEVADAEAKMQRLTSDVESLLEENKDEIRQEARAAARTAKSLVEDFTEKANSFSCGTGTGVDQSVPEDRQVEIARELSNNKELQYIAEMAGRIERIAKQAKQDKVETHGGGSIIDIETTGQYSKVTPTELASIAHPVTKAAFHQRLLNHSALSFKRERKDKAGKGPIICCVDNSGSMGGYSKDAPILWAKAVALALYRECAERGKPFYYVAFSSGYRKDDGLKVQKFSAKPGEELEFIQFSKTFLNGGTDYELALEGCLECFDDDDMAKADVVFISDGEYPTEDIPGVTDSYKDQMKKLGGCTLGIQIKPRHRHFLDVERPFGEFADSAWVLDLASNSGKSNDKPILTEMFRDWLT